MRAWIGYRHIGYYIVIENSRGARWYNASDGSIHDGSCTLQYALNFLSAAPRGYKELV